MTAMNTTILLRIFVTASVNSVDKDIQHLGYINPGINTMDDKMKALYAS